ncbi:copper resistance protein CopC [Bradyrhizobium sp. USDA 10063]
MENDVCKMKIGQMFMHFTGYQPQNSRAEFCQDIPEVGRAIIVLDMVDAQLRDLPTTFEIVRASGTATLQDINAVNPKDVVVKLGRRTYPNGSIKADMIFREPGDYVGVVMVEAETPTLAVFPFSVGQNSFWRSMAIFVAALVVATGAIFLWVRKSMQIAGSPGVPAMRMLPFVCAALLAMCRPGHAHRRLLSFTPGANAIVASPQNLCLAFGEKVERQLTGATVTCLGTESVAAGETAVSPDGTVVEIALPELPKGSCTVCWHAVSVDGNRSTGEFNFTVR